uniref:RING-type domain-containing protein n=1 Tax=Globisporangium ultimum (strain ATCC 200006 / CBS 805.95 / DAOM BR144) TaxID=431595 RepID=K3WQ97_GLOUD
MASHASVKSQECHICLEELRQDLVACPCGHVFHHACILQALQVNTQCPICRRYAAESHLISLYFDVPGESPSATNQSNSSSAGNEANDRDPSSEGRPAEEEAQVAKLNERVSMLVERLQWQKKQYDLLIAEMKRVRHQSEQLVMDKQALMQRVSNLEANKSVLVNKVAKYQIELSRQAEQARQTAVNQSIINYLNTCDAEAMEEEIQNPRELIMALKKACKFRHDQYQKVVKEKTRLKAMLQSVQQHPPHHSQQQQLQQKEDDRIGKGKLKGGFSNGSSKRHYSMDYANTAAPPHPLELKKRKTDPSSLNSMPAPSPADSSAPVHFTPRNESAGFRANAYSDVSVRSVTAARPTFSRSSFNPNQYGAYNLTPANEPSVQMSNHTVCRRGYDETGKLTNFFLTKEPKRGAAHSDQQQQQKTIPSMQHLLGVQHGASSSAPVAANQRPAGDRREYALTSWLQKESA